MNRFKDAFGLLKEAGMRMGEDQTPMMGAALAYYMIFSIAPLLVIAIGAAGVVFGRGADTGIFDGLQGFLGADGAKAVQSMVEAAASRPHAGMVATVVGVITLLVGASGVFSQLQQSLNIIWRVATKPGETWHVLLRQRLLSFGMIAVFGLLMLVSMIVSAGLSVAGQWAGDALPGGKILWSVVNVAVSFAIIAGMFSAVLKFLPDVELSWSDVRVGGAFTAVLFVIGKAAIGAYIGRSGVSSSYGAAGSLIVVLLWVFYSSQILFFGAEFTRAWAMREGRRVVPKRGAVLTVIPFTAATLAERSAEGNADPLGETWAPDRETWFKICGGALYVSALLLAKRPRKAGVVSAGAAAAGAALGILALLEKPELMADEAHRHPAPAPSVASRVLKRIPLRVKLGAAAGALRGGWNAMK